MLSANDFDPMLVVVLIVAVAAFLARSLRLLRGGMLRVGRRVMTIM